MQTYRFKQSALYTDTLGISVVKIAERSGKKINVGRGKYLLNIQMTLYGHIIAARAEIVTIEAAGEFIWQYSVSAKPTQKAIYNQSESNHLKIRDKTLNE